MPNEPVKGQVYVEKTGPMLTNVTQKTTEYGEVVQPLYEEKGLEGITYYIYAAEEINSADGTEHHYDMDEKVDELTTGKDGIGVSPELYIGKYYLREVDSVNNQVLLSEEKIPFEIKYKDQFTKVVELI